MLHLFKADLVIIDGIVGGEGNCPAPVDPVASRVIISGNHSVETDRVATRLMGFDPATIPLMRIADKEGFADPQVEVIGEPKIIPFKPADPSLTGPWMREHFPHVRVLIGHSKNDPPQPDADGCLACGQIGAMENVCRGGCLATTRYAFDMFVKEGMKRDFALTLILGAGQGVDGKTVYYDADGKPYTVDQIKALPGKKMAVGHCARGLAPYVDKAIDGCMPFPNSPHQALHLLTGQMCTVMSLKNRFLFAELIATLRVCEARKTHYRSGLRLDIPLGAEDRVFEPRVFTGSEKEQEYIYEPYPPLSKAEIKELCRQENRNILATFNP
jgi:hypothetical protein